MPVLKVAARRGAGSSPGRRRRTRRCPGPGSPGPTSCDSQIRAAVEQDTLALVHDGGAVALPAPEKYVAPIAFDVIPLAGSIVDDGLHETDEEQKLRHESRKILDVPDLLVSGHVRARAGVHRATRWRQRGVRAPATPSARPSCWPTPRASSSSDVPTPLEAAGQDPSFVGRIRQDEGAPEGSGPRAVRLQRQPPQGRRAQRGADRGAGRGRAPHRRLAHDIRTRLPALLGATPAMHLHVPHVARSDDDADVHPHGVRRYDVRSNRRCGHRRAAGRTISARRRPRRRPEQVVDTVVVGAVGWGPSGSCDRYDDGRRR